MNYQEILTKFNNKTPIYWRDPQPIPGNDYKISYIEHIQEELDEQDFVLIHYNQGGSEAQVFLHEIVEYDINFAPLWNS